MNAQLFTEPLTMVLKSVGNRVSEIRQDGEKAFSKRRMLIRFFSILILMEG